MKMSYKGSVQPMQEISRKSSNLSAIDRELCLKKELQMLRRMLFEQQERSIKCNNSKFTK